MLSRLLRTLISNLDKIEKTLKTKNKNLEKRKFLQRTLRGLLERLMRIVNYFRCVATGGLNSNIRNYDLIKMN